MPGGERRLANVRKLMRLGARARGRCRQRSARVPRARRTRGAGEGGASDSRESEAPVEGEALDAVRLMTIHRAKGLEFDDRLRRRPRARPALARRADAGRARRSLRLAAVRSPGPRRRESALDYRALGEEQQQAEAREERRLFYVAMTRARERLIVSGAARLELVAVGRRADRLDRPGARLGRHRARVIEQGSRRRPSSASRFEFVRRGGSTIGVLRRHLRHGASACRARGAAAGARAAAARRARPAPVAALSYSSLGEYRAAATGSTPSGCWGCRGRAPRRSAGRPRRTRPPSACAAPSAASSSTRCSSGSTSAARSADPGDDRRGGAAAAIGTRSSDTEAEERGRTGRALRRQRAVRAAGRAPPRCRARGAVRVPARAARCVVTGALDVLAREPGGRSLVVDYKSDRLDGADPRDGGRSCVRDAAAGLRAGGAARRRRGGRGRARVPGGARRAGHRDVLSAAIAPELERRAGGARRRRARAQFTVTEAPHRAVCQGCPAEGGLCSWPLAMTRREAPDRLF